MSSPWLAFIGLVTDILKQIYSFCGDWGLAIIILTLIVRILLTPLMTRSTRSSAKMQVLQPKMKEIQDRYADDPERMQKEMSKFYAENKFNPLGGCLPILLQMPIFFALFGVIKNVGELSGGHASFYNIVPDLTVGPGNVFYGVLGPIIGHPENPVASILDVVFHIGAIDLATWQAAAIYIFLNLLFGVLTLIPMLLNTTTTVDPQQLKTSRMMGIIMAVWMVWIGWGMPCGVLLYYNTSAIWQVAQQQFITKRVMAQAKAQAEADLESQPIQVDVERRERKKRPHKKG